MASTVRTPWQHLLHIDNGYLTKLKKNDTVVVVTGINVESADFLVSKEYAIAATLQVRNKFVIPWELQYIEVKIHLGLCIAWICTNYSSRGSFDTSY